MVWEIDLGDVGLWQGCRDQCCFCTMLCLSRVGTVGMVLGRSPVRQNGC